MYVSRITIWHALQKLVRCVYFLTKHATYNDRRAAHNYNSDTSLGGKYIGLDVVYAGTSQ